LKKNRVRNVYDYSENGKGNPKWKGGHQEGEPTLAALKGWELGKRGGEVKKENEGGYGGFVRRKENERKILIW
jgi:hypothetical protein